MLKYLQFILALITHIKQVKITKWS